MYRPHDLLHIDPLELRADREIPGWAQEALRQYPWVVVRRQVALCPGYLSVGIRGASRSQRFAVQMADTAVRKCLAPYALVNLIDGRLRTSPFPALAALPALATLLEDWSWGPSGSVAFHLCTGAPCITVSSDLDIVLYPRMSLLQSEAKVLLQRIRSYAQNADVLIETPAGAYALAEYAEGKASLLCRTVRGPVLSQHPAAELVQLSRVGDFRLPTEAR